MTDVAPVLSLRRQWWAHLEVAHKDTSIAGCGKCKEFKLLTLHEQDWKS